MAQDNDLSCTRRCGGELFLVAPLALQDLEGYDFGRLPYPVALTAHRLASALQKSGDVLKTLFLLKDCFEATIKYLGAVLLAEYRHSPACTKEHTELLLKSLMRPSLGTWVSDVVRPLSQWLISNSARPGCLAAALFAEPAAKPTSKPAESARFRRCKQFVTYRNDALGHGAQRRDSAYEKDLADWLPLVRHLLDDVASLMAWPFCLVIAQDRCQVWLGPEPGTTTEPGSFPAKTIGHFVLCDPEPTFTMGARPEASGIIDLYPFLCYLPDQEQADRLHYYDSLHRYTVTKKEATVLEYDHGSRHPRLEPIIGMEEAFTAELLAKAFDKHRSRMEIIEGRVANFGELIETHSAIVGRSFVIAHIHNFLANNDRGLLVIEAEPGKGKTALLAHLIDEVFGHYAPPPVHFFYRRTAGITDPETCVRSIYAALLEAHDITEAEEGKQKNSPDDIAIKLTNLLSQEIAPRLLPGRPQLLLIDALDEAADNVFQRIPENLPTGVYIIATTRPLSDRTVLARRKHLHWLNLDAPDLLQHNLQDGFDYVQRELVGTDFSNETLVEIARIGAGNFLVLTLLCQHLQTSLPPNQVATFLQRLATDGGKDHLGFIYAEFWSRLTERCTREDTSLLCNVAGILVTAHAPLAADMIRDVLGLRVVDWDFALRHLAEYLTVIEYDEGGECVCFYRIYHESFAAFVRDKVKHDCYRLNSLFAEFCLRWTDIPDNAARTYAIRFAPVHLAAASRQDDLVALLMSLAFLESKVENGFGFELCNDYKTVLRTNTLKPEPRRILGLLLNALNRDISFITRHPTSLFQCLWNSGWWYDSMDTVNHYPLALNDIAGGGCPWNHAGAKLSNLLNGWRKQKEARDPGFRWLRALRPPAIPIGLYTPLVGHLSKVTTIDVSRNAAYAVSASHDRTLRLWELSSGRELVCVPLHELIDVVRFSAIGDRVYGAGREGTLYAWSALNLVQLRATSAHKGAISSIALSGNEQWLFTGGRDRALRVWNAMALTRVTELLPSDDDSEWGDVHSVAVDPTESTVLLMAGTNLYQWTWREGSLLKLAACKGTMAYAAQSPQGDTVLLAFLDIDADPDDGQVIAFIYDADTVAQWRNIDGLDEDIHAQAVASFTPCVSGIGNWQVAYSADGQKAAVVGEAGGFSLWSREYGARSFNTISGQIHSIAFAGNESVLCGTYEGVIEYWDCNALRKRVNPIYTYDAFDVYNNQWVISPDGSYLAVMNRWSPLQDVQLWNCGTGRIITSTPVDRGGELSVVTVMAISGNARMIVCGLSDGGVWILDRMGNANAEPAIVYPFSFDNRRPQPVVIQFIESGVIDRSGESEFGHKTNVECIAVSNTGGTVILGTDTGHVALWDGQPHTQWIANGHEAAVTAVSLSPDESCVASGSQDRTLAIWNADNGELLDRIDLGDETVAQIAFSSDGAVISCCLKSGLIKTYNLPANGGESDHDEHGWPDVRFVEGDPVVNPFRASLVAGELQIHARDEKDACAWAPMHAPIQCLKPHPSGREWVVMDVSLQFYVLEGK